MDEECLSLPSMWAMCGNDGTSFGATVESEENKCPGGAKSVELHLIWITPHMSRELKGLVLYVMLYDSKALSSYPKYKIRAMALSKQHQTWDLISLSWRSKHGKPVQCRLCRVGMDG